MWFREGDHDSRTHLIYHPINSHATMGSSLIALLTLLALSSSAVGLATPKQVRDATGPDLLTDINVIKRYWGQVSDYLSVSASMHADLATRSRHTTIPPLRISAWKTPVCPTDVDSSVSLFDYHT